PRERDGDDDVEAFGDDEGGEEPVGFLERLRIEADGDLDDVDDAAADLVDEHNRHTGQGQLRSAAGIADDHTGDVDRQGRLQVSLEFAESGDVAEVHVGVQELTEGSAEGDVDRVEEVGEGDGDEGEVGH